MSVSQSLVDKIYFDPNFKRYATRCTAAVAWPIRRCNFSGSVFSPGLFEAPDVNRRMSQQRFSLCLSGHTHGGQVTIGDWSPFRPVGSGRFVAGFYDVPGCRLYVSKGLGTSICRCAGVLSQKLRCLICEAAL